MKNCPTVRRLTIACLLFIQATLPCLVFAQTGRGSGASAPAGLINSVSGSVFARGRSGEEVLLKAGDVFGPDTTFRSGADGNVVLLFADGQNITLGKDSTLRVDEYRFDARDPKANQASINLVSGVMNFVTGAIHTSNPQGMKVSIGEASISILSRDVTAFIVEVDPKSTGLGVVAVTVGELSVRTRTGSASTVSSEQFVRWRPGTAPSSPAPLAVAPAVFQAEVAGLRATVLPSNEPIDFQSAAVQAALAGLPATGAGTTRPQTQQAQAVESVAAIVIPAATPGGGRGCAGSPC